MYRVLKETAYENKMQNVLKLSFFSISCLFINFMIHAYLINCGFCLTIPMCKSQLLSGSSLINSLTMHHSLLL